MVFSPTLEAGIVITVPPNVHVSTMKNPFPFYQDEAIRDQAEVQELIQTWLKKRTPDKINHSQELKREEVKQIKSVLKSDRMKKIVSVCTNAVADTKENAVARLFKCFLQGFEKS